MNLQISFRDMEPSPALEDTARRHAEKLEKAFPSITNCRVMIETPHKHHAKGGHHHVRVDITIPGEEIVATRDPDERAANEDAYVAIRDAFKAARREVREHLRRLRRDRHAA